MFFLHQMFYGRQNEWLKRLKLLHPLPPFTLSLDTPPSLWSSIEFFWRCIFHCKPGIRNRSLVIAWGRFDFHTINTEDSFSLPFDFSLSYLAPLHVHVAGFRMFPVHIIGQYTLIYYWKPTHGARVSFLEWDNKLLINKNFFSGRSGYNSPEFLLCSAQTLRLCDGDTWMSSSRRRYVSIVWLTRKEK